MYYYLHPTPLGRPLHPDRRWARSVSVFFLFSQQRSRLSRVIILIATNTDVSRQVGESTRLGRKKLQIFRVRVRVVL